MSPRPEASPSWPWAAALAVYFVLTSTAHLRFSVWLVSARESPFGPFSVQQLVPAVAAVAALCLLFACARDIRRVGWASRRSAAWALWWLAMLLVDRTLTYSLNEIAHTPQYAWLAWLLARTLDPHRERWRVGRVLWFSVLLGAADEALQYVWIAADYGDYFDFNDLLADLLGAVLGVLLYYPATGAPRRRPGRPVGGLLAAAALLAGVAAANAMGVLQVEPPGPVPPGGLLWNAAGRPTLYLQREVGAYGSVRKGHRRPTYRVLAPAEGVLLCALAGTAFTLLLGVRPRPWVAPDLKPTHGQET